MRPRLHRVLVPLCSSLLVHAGIAAAVSRLSPPAAPARQVALQIAVLDAPPPVTPVAPQVKPPNLLPPPPHRRARMKLARLAPPPETPPPRSAAPPPPSAEAKEKNPAPLVVTGITLESTSEGGSFAVGTGNTLMGTPAGRAAAPGSAAPYKAGSYASAGQLTGLPRPLNAGSVNLRRYYPEKARKDGFEGDVVLRLLIAADGSVARADIISDPGEGLGAAAALAVQREYRFSPGTVNGVPVATTVPFTVHFTLD